MRTGAGNFVDVAFCEDGLGIDFVFASLIDVVSDDLSATSVLVRRFHLIVVLVRVAVAVLGVRGVAFVEIARLLVKVRQMGLFQEHESAFL